MNMYYPRDISGNPWKYGSMTMFVLADSAQHADQTLRSWLLDRRAVHAVEELRLCTMFKVPLKRSTTSTSSRNLFVTART